MKNIKIFAAIGAVVTFIVIVSFVILSQNPNAVTTTETRTSSSSPVTISVGSTSTSSTSTTANVEPGSGIYKNYVEGDVASYPSKQKVLFFYANWCPSCRGQDESLNSNLAAIPSDLVILKVDYDNSTSLKQKYGVTLQHTFVQVDENGNLLAKWNTLYGDYSIENIIRNLL
ncbi:MAG: thioredoxin family protein [Candidatus Doudnabacteria bacterium]|nr:thioredoxin family protein [Candidatus Doudnabacteria bacterium]